MSKPMLKIYSYNVNGIRAALNKGFLEWLSIEQPDIIGLQEIKAKDHQFDASIFEELGYQYISFPAEKLGYSGVALLTKKEPIKVTKGIGHDLFDAEGRVVVAHYSNFSVASIYFPSGSSGDERQNVKYDFLEAIVPFVRKLREEHPNLILVGDYNICHQAIDIHNPIANANTSGFLPKEREWMTQFLEEGFTDTFRYLNSNPHNYTWWSYRAGARPKNLGWRIDYIAITTHLNAHIKKVSILKDAMHSDHCPISVELDLEYYEVRAS
jgi:exodeoxyribonuclease-3